MSSGPSSVEMNVVFVLTLIAICCVCFAFVQRRWWAWALGASLCAAGAIATLSWA